MRKNVVEPERPQMTIGHMGFECWITKATGTHSEYIILLFHGNNGYANTPQRYVIRLVCSKRMFNIRNACGIFFIIFITLYTRHTLFTSQLNCSRPNSRGNERLKTNIQPDYVDTASIRNVGFRPITEAADLVCSLRKRQYLYRPCVFCEPKSRNTEMERDSTIQCQKQRKPSLQWTRHKTLVATPAATKWWEI